MVHIVSLHVCNISCSRLRLEVQTVYFWKGIAVLKTFRMRKILMLVVIAWGWAVGTGSAQTTYGKIPIDAKRWYQLNNVSNGLQGLFDSVLSVPVGTGTGKVLGSFDAYYPILPGEQMNIDSIKFYDGVGSNVADPFTLYYIDSAWDRILIGTFIGTELNVWVGPDPASMFDFSLAVPANNVRYLLINCSSIYPNEMELYGSYVAPAPVAAAPAKTISLKQELGVNGFEWDFEDPANPSVIDPLRLAAAKTFTGFRHYLDWSELEPNEGGYTFNPSHNGSWNYDSLYQRCKMEGIEVLADIKTQPDYMVATYPTADQDAENVPVDYGADFTDPASYIKQAQMAFQFAARYGNNPLVSPSLLSVDSSTRWTGDPANTIQAGLGVVKYIECDNERDKWWKGREAYQTGREYAANLSAFYDGNNNTMGAGIGVKNADPNMMVVMGGTAGTTTDYFRGMIDWCKEYRGYNADGTVNLCWDVINYHIYSSNAAYAGGSGLRGAAPEVAGADVIARNFVNAAHLYANDMPVWISEAGYDINPGSDKKAIPIGSKTALQTQADWLLRTSLLNARCSIERTFFYELYDDDIASPAEYSSCGLINPDRSRKPAADYIYQANNLIGDYVYKETLQTNPIVDRYELGGKSAYVLVKPTENGSVMSYSLSIGTATSAQLYTPSPGHDVMDIATLTAASGHVSLTVGETPLFVIPTAARAGIAPGASTLLQDISVFPNPASQTVTLCISNNSTDEISVSLYAADGKACGNYHYTKNAATLSASLDISELPCGLYFIEISQGDEKTIKRIIKTR